ncbi:hypothetical protein R1flu_011510 [Riccia fluitans]|uniref:Uncharacterized protein n=1 Tax=Riccia fluitans TaxID=41844 RepID=A0ABD1Z949_9MARC
MEDKPYEEEGNEEEVENEEEEEEDGKEEEDDKEEKEERNYKCKFKTSKFIDDMANEDEIEVEEGPRKRRNGQATQYIDDIVAVASDEEEEKLESGEEEMFIRMKAWT